LWEVERAAGSTTLRAATLAELGGAGQVVADHLERAIEALTADQQALAAVLFDHLVTPSGTKIAHEASDLAQFAGVTEAEVRPVLASLVESRIVRTDEGGRYEIFHDVLAGAIVGWSGRFHAEQALAQERRRRRRAVAVAMVALVAVGLMTAVTAYALSQRATARDQARVANARQLQAASDAVLRTDPELGLLLATEALRQDPTASSEHAVREALLASRVRGILRDGPVTSAAYALDGAGILTGGRDGVARVYDRRGQQLLRELRHGAPVTAVAGLPDGKRVVTAGMDGVAIIWDAVAGAPLRRLRHGGGPIRALAVSSDGARVVTGGRDGKARVWDASSGRLVATLAHPKPVEVVRLSLDGRLVATGVGDRFARVWDADTGRLLHSLDQGGFVEDVAFAPDGDGLATAGANRTARLWNVRTGRLRLELTGHRGRVVGVAFGPRGHLLATASTDGTARIWRIPAGVLMAPLVGHRNLVLDVAFSPDGNWVVTSSADGTARTWTTEDGHLRATLVGHDDAVLSAVFAAQGDAVLTLGADGTARVWDGGTTPELAPARKVVGRIAGKPARVVSTPDSRITARAVGKTIVLDTPDGRLVLRGHDDRVNALAVSPDGTLLASASRDHRIRLWDLPSGRLHSVLKGHFGSVADVEFSPGGEWLVSAGPTTAGLWPVDGSEGVTLLRGPEQGLRAAAFTPDGRAVVTREIDGTARRWSCEICGGAEELQAQAERRLTALGRQLTDEERARYLG
jgi:WD40 repeat protein